MNWINQLSYLVIESSKDLEWSRFASDFVGMEAVPARADRWLRLRMDDRAYRLLVKPGDSEDIWAAGFQVYSDEALQSFQEHLRRMEIRFQAATVEELAQREVEKMIWLQDPEGLRLEISYNPRSLSEVARTPLVPGGFLTGDLGFGHIAICAADRKLCEAFYRDVMGFRLSDYIVQDIQGVPIGLTFFHVNPRHHTLALAGIPAPTRLNHLMVEVTSVDVIGHALERAKQQGINLYMNLGRHPNDRMLSFYANTPSNFAIEYGCGGLQIRDEAAWEIKTHDALSEWGHKD